MSWMEHFETLVNGFFSSTNVVRSFVLEVARVLDPTMKINLETIYLFIYLNFLSLSTNLSTFKSKLNHLLIESLVPQELIRNNIY